MGADHEVCQLAELKGLHAHQTAAGVDARFEVAHKNGVEVRPAHLVRRIDIVARARRGRRANAVRRVHQPGGAHGAFEVASHRGVAPRVRSLEPPQLGGQRPNARLPRAPRLVAPEKGSGKVARRVALLGRDELRERHARGLGAPRRIVPHAAAEGGVGVGQRRVHHVLIHAPRNRVEKVENHHAVGGKERRAVAVVIVVFGKHPAVDGLVQPLQGGVGGREGKGHESEEIGQVEEDVDILVRRGIGIGRVRVLRRATKQGLAHNGLVLVRRVRKVGVARGNREERRVAHAEAHGEVGGRLHHGRQRLGPRRPREAHNRVHRRRVFAAARGAQRLERVDIVVKGGVHPGDKVVRNPTRLHRRLAKRLAILGGDPIVLCKLLGQLVGHLLREAHVA